MWVERTSCGEKAALRARGLGPWTVQESLSEDVAEIMEVEEGIKGWSSRYAEPDAEGVSPVRRTLHNLLAWGSSLC